MNRSLPIFLAAVLLVPTLVLAEGDEEQVRAEQQKLMDQRFGITEEQRAKMRQIREDGGSRKEIRAVLTEEQREQMRQWRKEHPEEAKKARKKMKEKKKDKQKSGQGWGAAEPDARREAPSGSGDSE